MKGIAVVFAMLGLTLLQAQADFRTIEHDRHNPHVVVIDSHLVSVSKNQSHIEVRSVNDSTKPCSIEINPIDEEIQGRIRAAALGNGQKIVVWGNRQVDIGSTVNLEYTLLLVDPYDCSYQAVSVPEERRPKILQNVSPRVLVYDQGFDVFFPSQRTCSPCRFTDQGERIPLDYQLSDENAVVHESTGFLIQAFNSSNFSQGFFYAYNFDNKTAVMKLLDGGFDIVRQIRVNHTVNAISLQADYLPMIAICYATPDVSNALLLPKGEHQEIHCERLDSALKPLYSIPLPIPENYFVSGLSLNVDSFGKCYIAVGQSPILQVDENADKSPQLRFFHADSAGRIDESSDLAKIIVDDTKSWELYGYFVADQYCLVGVLPKNLQDFSYREIVNCAKLIE